MSSKPASLLIVSSAVSNLLSNLLTKILLSVSRFLMPIHFTWFFSNLSHFLIGLVLLFSIPSFLLNHFKHTDLSLCLVVPLAEVSGGFNFSVCLLYLPIVDFGYECISSRIFLKKSRAA